MVAAVAISLFKAQLSIQRAKSRDNRLLYVRRNLVPEFRCIVHHVLLLQCRFEREQDVMKKASASASERPHDREGEKCKFGKYVSVLVCTLES